MKINHRNITIIGLALVGIAAYACTTTTSPVCNVAGSGPDQFGTETQSTAGQNLDFCDGGTNVTTGCSDCTNEPQTQCIYTERIQLLNGDWTPYVPVTNNFTPSQSTGDDCPAGG